MPWQDRSEDVIHVRLPRINSVMSLSPVHFDGYGRQPGQVLETMNASDNAMAPCISGNGESLSPPAMRRQAAPRSQNRGERVTVCQHIILVVASMSLDSKGVKKWVSTSRGQSAPIPSIIRPFPAPIIGSRSDRFVIVTHRFTFLDGGRRSGPICLES